MIVDISCEARDVIGCIYCGEISYNHQQKNFECGCNMEYLDVVGLIINVDNRHTLFKIEVTKPCNRSDKILEKYIVNSTEVKEESIYTCKCDMVTLMRSGCKCGGI